MGDFTEKALVYGLKFGFNFLNTKQQEAVGAVLKISKYLPDDKILEFGKRISPPFNADSN
jgi:hypothetical protein